MTFIIRALFHIRVCIAQNETMTSEKVVVRLETKKNANDKFKGFLVMAFDAVNDAEPIGRFDDPISNDNAKIVQCPAPFTLNVYEIF